MENGAEVSKTVPINGGIYACRYQTCDNGKNSGYIHGWNKELAVLFINALILKSFGWKLDIWV